jgi:hypothetical protein
VSLSLDFTGLECIGYGTAEQAVIDSTLDVAVGGQIIATRSVISRERYDTPQLCSVAT